MEGPIAIAVSGGIDSLVAAALLKEQGHRLVALHFLTGYECAGGIDNGAEAIKTDADHAIRRKIQRLSDQLDIPVHIIDLGAEFKNVVVDYFVHTYRQGRTPNPCLVCNPKIKFDILFQRAQVLGANRMATGHYARNVIGSDGRPHLMRGVDLQKDQSYFLAHLTPRQLARAVFPLGAYTKAQTRAIAAQKGLEPTTPAESQDVCFIKNARYGEFIARQPGFVALPGPIEDLRGQLIGRHQGLHLFTIGQRRGINAPAAQPYYVVRMDMARNCLVVGAKEQLLTGSCRVERINWITLPPQGPRKIKVRVRYRHRAVAATLTPVGESAARVVFERPEPAVTPGQGAVFYADDEVLGGGWIA